MAERNQSLPMVLAINLRKQGPQVILSQKSRETCLAKLKKTKLFESGNEKRAAVLIPLCVVDGNVSLLYTLRSSNLKNYSGHISFPGGKSDGEETPTETALRETEEELGIPQDQIDIWGEGPALPSKNNELCVTPVVGEIKDFDMDKLQPAPDEVEEVFTVPIQWLCDPANQAHTQFQKGFILPVFIYKNKQIWGMTAFITHIFLTCLLPAQYYRNDFIQKKVKPKL